MTHHQDEDFDHIGLDVKQVGADKTETSRCLLKNMEIYMMLKLLLLFPILKTSDCY